MTSNFSKITTLFFIGILSIEAALGQENCADGVDNNNDGFIDCYDELCANSAECSDFYLGNSVVCADEPTDNPAFSMRLQWASDNQTADSYGTPIIGDLDDNGVPEVVTINWLQRKMFYLNGANGSVLHEIDLGFNPQWQAAIGDVTGDGCAYVYVTEYKSSGSSGSSIVRAYDCNAQQVWQHNTSKLYGPHIPGLADFDQDGIPELYYKDEILNARTGDVIVSGGQVHSGTYSWYYDVAFGVLALDILSDGCNGDCSGLELIVGGEIYSVDTGSGTLTLEKNLDDIITAAPYNLTEYEFRYYRTYISAADYNLDGNVDIILSGAVDINGNPQTTVFAWDVANNTLIGDGFYQDTGNNWSRGTGRINIADLDDDGQLNMTYVSGESLYALDEDLNLLWKVGIKETSSGFTGCTMFDFDGDGTTEVVYRSEESLLVINTDKNDPTNPTISGESRFCVSRTAEEYPVVADVDGDGASEICVTCVTDDNMSIDGNNYVNTQYSQVRVFEADGGEVWQPARQVWNQHAYFNVNVNDDLTVPRVQQDHTRIFGDVDCVTGDPIENRALNGFLNQSTYIDETGCPSFVSPDLDIVGDITASRSQCPSVTFDVSFDIQNTGDSDISGSLPVTFYAGNPQVASPAPTKLNTEIAAITNLLVGETITLTLPVEGIGGDFHLYVSINDIGQDAFPITLTASSIAECETDNNIGDVAVTYDTFSLDAFKVSDNEKCLDSKPDNGEAIAYFEGTVPGEVQTIWLEDFGLNGLGEDALGDTEDASGDSRWHSQPDPSYTPDSYGVGDYFGDNAFEGEDTGGTNLNGDLSWFSQSIDITGFSDVTITVDLLSNSSCDFSGQYQDRIQFFYSLDGGVDQLLNNGDQSGAFGYVQASISGLSGSSINLTCFMHTSGSNEYHGIDNVRVRGTTPETTKQFTDADGYEFKWYEQGNVIEGAELFTGGTYATMAEGNYSVVGMAPTNCYSDTVDITIDRTTPVFRVWAYTLDSLKNCSTPDGILHAFAYTDPVTGPGDPQDTLISGYTFNWISEDGITVVGTGDTLKNIEDIPYIVRVTQELTGCAASLEDGTVTVGTSLSKPELGDIEVTPTHVTDCDGTGEFSATVAGSTSGFTFQWYSGGAVKPTPDYTGSTVTGLEVGEYTLRVIDDATSCGSDPVQYDIEDNSANPLPTITINSHNTSCDASGYNGSARADNGVSGAVYTFYAGTTTAKANELPGDEVPTAALDPSDAQTITGLPSGIYSVNVKKGGCQVLQTFEILDETETPVFNFIESVDAGDAINFSNKSWIEIPQAIAGWEEITISYWAYLANENYLNDHLIFSSGGTSEDQIVLWTDNTDGLAFVVKTEGDNNNGRINTAYKPTGWTQLTGVWSLNDIDGDGNAGDMAIYADGVLLGTDNYVGTGNGLFDAGATMYIARDANLGTNKFEGRIDEFRLYNKAFLPSDVNDAVCSDVNGSEEGLVIYYSFDGLSDTNDEATIPNIGTAVNTTDGNQSGSAYDATVQLSGQGSIAYATSNIDCPLGIANNNTSCDPATPNGSMDLTGKIDPAGGNYEYTLYSGYSTTTVLDGPKTSPLFSGLPGGFYTLVVTDLDSDCSTDDFPFALADIPDNPTIVTSVTNDVGCNSLGLGEIEVTSYSNVAEPSSYTYELFDGPAFTTAIGSPITVNDGSIGNTYTGLTDGVYRIRVTNDDQQCNFFEDVIVGNNSSDPVVTRIDLVPNTSCNTGNGSLNVQMPGDDVADYTYVWYAGSTADPANIISGETEEILDDISATSPSANGQYTVVVTEIATGCSSSAETKTMTDNPSFPLVFIDEVSPETGCIAGAGGNGVAEAYTDEGLGKVTVGYTVEWFSDLGLTSAVASTDNGTTNIASTLSSGTTYYVRITSNSTGCSAVNTINVSQTPVYPTISLSSKSPNITCDPTQPDGPTGSATIAASFEGSNVTDFTGYTFTWYEGSGTGGHNITTSGTGSNGIAASGAATQTLSNVIDSTYTVVATAPNGCISNTLNVVIDYTPPTLSMTTVSIDDNTVCDETLAGAFDGEIVVSPDTGVPSDYSFQWFVGSGTGGTSITTTSVSSTEARAFELEGDMTYTLLVTDLGSGCFNTFTYNIQNIPAQPIIVPSESTITDNTTCGSDPNGSVVAAIDLNNAVLNGRSNDEVWQTFSTCNSEILDDATQVGTNGFQLTTETNNQFGRVWLGDSIDLSEPLRLDFRIYLGNKGSSGADGIAFTMHRDPAGYDARGKTGSDLGVAETPTGTGSGSAISPAVSIEFDTWWNGASFGDISTSNSRATEIDHTTLFYNGDIRNPEFAPVAIRADSDEAEPATPDTLNVSIIVTNSGGMQTVELWVNENLRFTHTDDIINNVFGGETKLIAGFTSSTGGANNDQAVFLQPNFGEYNFAWVDSGNNTVGGNDPFICGVGPGDYTLTVTHGVTGCVSDTETFTVGNAVTAIDAIITVDQLPTTCSGGTPNGQLTASNGNDDGGPYSYQWYQGSGTGGTELTVDSTNPTLSDLYAGTYTVLITDLFNPNDECYNTAEVTISESKPTIDINGTENGASNCDDLDNGSYVITSITEDFGSGAVAANIADFEFDLYDNGGNFVVTETSATIDGISGLEASSYSLILRNTTTGCTFSSYPFTIDDIS
ncbi:MAG: hypothetical protein JXR03_05230, partial [Cyclobacteriaceae bacterium]